MCQLLYIIIFVPYNLFKLFLVHKISAYKYICENGKKKWEKEKEKEFQANWVEGDFGPVGRGRAASWPIGPRRPTRSRDGAADAVGVGPRAREGKGRRRQGERRAVRAGENRSPVNPTAVPRRWPGSTWMEWWQSTSGGRGSRRWSQFGQRVPGVAGPWRGGGCSRR